MIIKTPTVVRSKTQEMDFHLVLPYKGFENKEVVVVKAIKLGESFTGTPVKLNLGNYKKVHSQEIKELVKKAGCAKTQTLIKDTLGLDVALSTPKVKNKVKKKALHEEENLEDSKDTQESQPTNNNE